MKYKIKFFFSFCFKENIRDKKKTEELRRKIDEKKEKRQIEQRFARVRALGEEAAAGEEDSAAYWVERSRRIQKEKDEAAKRSKMLEEMDEAFGVGEVVTDELMKQKAKAYTSKDLRGLKVEHDRVSESVLLNYLLFLKGFMIINFPICL